jgi:hypothetical protein
MLTLVPELDSTNVLMTSTDSTTVDSTKVTVLKPTSELEAMNGIDVLMTSTVELADSTTVDGTEVRVLKPVSELEAMNGIDVLMTSTVELDP